MQIMHEVVKVKRSRVAAGALAFAEEHILSSGFGLRRFRPVQPPGDRIQLRSRREVEHVLHLRHMTHSHSVQNVRPLLRRPDWVAVEIRGALLKLREVLHGAQAPLRSVDLLVEYSAQACGIQTEPSFLRPDIRRQMELSSGVSVHVTVEAGYPKARVARLAVVRRVE